MVLEFVPRRIEKNDSYDCFKLLLCYSVVYDLNETNPTPIRFNEIVLKNVFDKYYQHPPEYPNIYFTDLLFM